MGNKVFYGIIGLIFVGFIVTFIVMNQQQSQQVDDALESGMYSDKDASELSDATISTLSEDNYQYNVTYDEHKEAVENGEEVYVYYWSPTCPYCMAETPLIMDAHSNYDDVNFMQVNVDEYSQVLEDPEIGLQGTPTLIKYSDGEKVTELIGAYEDDTVYESFFSGELDGYIQSEEENEESEDMTETDEDETE